jgi:DNA-binding transcriptional LysR family regulator
MAIELRHFRSFLAVANERHFGRAAKKLHIEQSPLSRIIRELEEHLSVKLFNRKKRPIALTRSGEVLKRDAEKVFSIIDQAIQNAKGAANGVTGLVRVALSDCIDMKVIAGLLQVCRHETPEVDIQLNEISPDQMVRGLKDDLFDVGFSHSCVDDESVSSSAVWQDRLIVVLPKNHPLLEQPKITLERLLQYPLILPSPVYCMGTYAQLCRILHSAGLPLKVCAYVRSFELMTSLVVAGYGLSLVSKNRFKADGIITRPLVEKAFMRIYMLKPASETLPLVDCFIKRVKSVSNLIAES